ncbi:hypothetical protein VNO77_23120 [Canavalia gladiata]|uniref:Uncharacterized protein n=1 Tax=Canavalia gladiata TaxID=3824 RepID=A0AAN9L4F0_CANGL
MQLKPPHLTKLHSILASIAANFTNITSFTAPGAPPKHVKTSQSPLFSPQRQDQLLKYDIVASLDPCIRNTITSTKSSHAAR